jgi:4-carboxymuconolactone decarboxylase
MARFYGMRSVLEFSGRTSGQTQYQPKETITMPAKPPPSGISQVRDIVPKLGELTDDVLFGDVWARAGLSKRDRSLITVAALTALYRSDQLRGHIWRALDNGVTKEEICELVTHLAFYTGWPNGIHAAQLAKQVFAERG